jgi:DNA-binding transcriptional MerR regulator
MERFYHTASAARRLGIHPQTLRRYEYQGKVSFARDEYGHRIFTENDLKQLRGLILQNQAA